MFRDPRWDGSRIGRASEVEKGVEVGAFGLARVALANGPLATTTWCEASHDVLLPVMTVFGPVHVVGPQSASAIDLERTQGRKVSTFFLQK
jgi:hypothetical protein